MVLYNIFETLTKVNGDGSITPLLAESWSMEPDGKSYTFKLNKGVKFHDGQPFTSDDVKFSILEVLRKVHPRGVNTFRAVESIDTPDASTVASVRQKRATAILRIIGPRTGIFRVKPSMVMRPRAITSSQ